VELFARLAKNPGPLVKVILQNEGRPVR